MLTNENVIVTSKEKNAPRINKNVSSANEDIQFSEINSSEQCPESDLPSTDTIEKKVHSTLVSEQLVKFAARWYANNRLLRNLVLEIIESSQNLMCNAMSTVKHEMEEEMKEYKVAN